MNRATSSLAGPLPLSDTSSRWTERYRRQRLTLVVRWGSFFAALALAAYSLDYLGIDAERLLDFLPRVYEVLSTRYYPPELRYVLEPDFLKSVLETLQMSLLGGAAGMALALPLAWLGAFNVSRVLGLHR